MPDLVTSIRALWVIQGPQLRLTLQRYATLTGLDPQGEGLSELILIPYILVFWLIWLLAVLGLAAGEVAYWLVQWGDPPTLAIQASVIGLAGYFLFELRRASRRSPFVFSPTDAQWLAPAPLHRSWVALDRFFRRCFLPGVLGSAAAIILAFALEEASRRGDLTLLELIPIVAAGIGATAIFIPLQLALQAAAWAIGAWRLRRDKSYPQLQRLVWLLGTLWAVWGVLASGRRDDLFLSALADFPLIAPVRVLAASAYRNGATDSLPWAAGFGLSILIAALGLYLLAWASRELNLARAAQETSLEGRIQAVKTPSVAQDLRQQARQGAQRSPTQLPGRAGAGALLWKHMLQWFRQLRADTLFSGLMTAGLAATWALDLGIGFQAWAALILAAQTSQRAPERLRQDLNVPWLLRQVPSPAWQIILTSLTLPLIERVTLAWIGLGIAQVISGQTSFSPLLLALLLPTGLLAAALGGTVDLLKTNENVPLISGHLKPSGSLGALLAIAGMVAPLGLWWWQRGLPGLLLGWVASALINVILLKVAEFLYRRL